MWSDVGERCAFGVFHPLEDNMQCIHDKGLSSRTCLVSDNVGRDIECPTMSFWTSVVPNLMMYSGIAPSCVFAVQH